MRSLSILLIFAGLLLAEPTCTGDNEIYTTCGAYEVCQLTCANPRPSLCPMHCKAGCVCKNGFLRYNGSCVDPEDCPIDSE